MDAASARLDEGSEGVDDGLTASHGYAGSIVLARALDVLDDGHCLGRRRVLRQRGKRPAAAAIREGEPLRVVAHHVGHRALHMYEDLRH